MGLGKHAFVESAKPPTVASGDAVVRDKIENKWTEVWETDERDMRESDPVREAIAGAVREAYAAGRAVAFARINMDNESLVSDVAYAIWEANKMQPSMDGQCKRLHDDAENRRTARAAIRAIAKAAKEGEG